MTGPIPIGGCRTLMAAVLLAACSAPVSTPTAIPFAPLQDASIRDPDNPTKVFRLDFARVEQEFPLSRADRLNIRLAGLAELSQEHIDQIYARLSAGPIPNGPYSGDLFFPRGENFQTRLGEILGGIGGRVVDAKLKIVESIGTTLWKGKVFDRDSRSARNLIKDLAPLRMFIDDPSTLTTSRLPRRGWLRLIFPEETVWQSFPAKIYCGQSLVDGRRESIVVDYNYGDEIPGYRANPDSLATRGGLGLRAELRMIRPGLYLGRAYLHRMFLLNFTVHDMELARREAANFAAGAAQKEDCWTGE
jgi:hypothetical protein